ncbi:PAP2-domain-containing protein [Meira miltonrushii]|uniref:PAP2-domain-containing protein n=1 Tax=Meira miltonrushii TaxID=1280837 RepID=A0A316V6P1_9BASI|nr:PAP2-domain-containing protein [Meira miltonrushii]PWN33257.1 PAP2-domain-containing protein [Meira miltonrushii]
MNIRQTLKKGPTGYRYLIARILGAATRLETSTSIQLTLTRLRQWQPTGGEKVKYTFMLVMALISLYVMKVPGFPLKLGLPAIFSLLVLLPITSQFFLPASPILLWLLIFYSSQFVPASSRPHIWVSVLPTLETVWYGASIADILTRIGHPALDILAWIPPFFVAAFLFVFAPPGTTKFYGAAFGFMNVTGVLIQFWLPCAPPWYELREGLTPANYDMKGSPAGLARIDQIFHGHGYTVGFTNAPVPFGAFPSLHSGNATMSALFCSYFFPLALELPLLFSSKRIRFDARILYWIYAFWLYWCTMYLMHHFLVDLVGGACLATGFFYYYLPDEIRTIMEQGYAYRPSQPAPTSAAPPSDYPREAFGTRSSTTTKKDGSVLFALGQDEEDDDLEESQQTSLQASNGEEMKRSNSANSKR